MLSSSSSGSSIPNITSLGSPNSSGVLLDQLHQFSREVVDLLKHQPGCQILLSKFIPSYHHHFGKQCRVADYGYSKLHELIDALPNVVHVMGSGHLRLLTLSHRVQIRRFTNELIKVLKSQSTKSCRLLDYPTLFRRIYRKDFRIADYGVCYLMDMLMEMSDSAVEISYNGPDCIIALPKRVQTMEERERTELFAIEVADLLYQSPRCRLPFNKFIPSYHHHFSRQCRVADYGFTKLIDLLEAVPNVVRIVEDHGEKYVSLVRQRHLRIVAEQLLAMLEAAPGKRILLSELLNVYLKHQGYALYLEDFQLSTIRELLVKLPRLVRIEAEANESVLAASNSVNSAHLEVNRVPTETQRELEPLAVSTAIIIDPPLAEKESSILDKPPSPEKRREEYVCLADRTLIKHLAHKVLLILLEASTGSLSMTQFSDRFRCTFRDEPNIQLIADELGDIVEFQGMPIKTSNEAPSLVPSASWDESENISSHVLLGGLCSAKAPALGEPITNVNAIAIDSPAQQPISVNPTLATTISLKPLIMFTKELRELLKQNQGKLLLVQLCTLYQRRYGVPLKPQLFNYPSLATLLQAVDFVAVMRGRGVRCTLILCQDFLGKLSYRVAYNTKPELNTDEEGSIAMSGFPDTIHRIRPDAASHSGRSFLANSQSNSSDHAHARKSSLLLSSETYSLDHLSSLCTYTASSDNGNSIAPHPQPLHLSVSSDMSLHSPNSRGGLPSVRSYTNQYASHSTPYANPFNSYPLTSTQLPPNSYGYYQISQQTPTPPSHSSVYATRSGYGPSANHMLRNPSVNFGCLQPTADYGQQANHPSDCHSMPSGSYTSVLYPPTVPCSSVAVLPTNSSTQPNPCFLGPTTDSSGGAGTTMQYPGQVYSNSTIYHQPYSLGLNYPAAAVHNLPPQLTAMTTATPTSNDIRSQPVLGMDPALAGAGGIRSTGTANYYSVDRNAIQRSTMTNFGHFNSSPGAQQQLDELVERLAYDNASLAALNTNQQLSLGTHRPDFGSSKPNQLSSSGFAQPSNLVSNSQLAYRNQLPQSGLMSNSFLNSLAATSDCATLGSPYHASIVSNYMASQNAQYTPYYTSNMLAGLAPSVPVLHDLYLSRGQMEANGLANYNLADSLTISTNVASNSGSKDGNSLIGRETNEGNLSGQDISQTSGNKVNEQLIRSLDDCGSVKPLLASVGHSNAPEVDRRLSLNANAGDHGDPVIRYPVHHGSNSVFSIDRCTTKGSQFVTSVAGGTLPIRDPVADLTNMNPEVKVSSGTSGTGSFMSSVVTNDMVSEMHSNMAHLTTGYEAAQSPEDSPDNFSLDGLLAELRMEEKQRQQQQQSAHNEHPVNLGDPEMELKQNTHMLLENFSYL